MTWVWSDECGVQGHRNIRALVKSLEEYEKNAFIKNQLLFLDQLISNCHERFPSIYQLKMMLSVTCHCHSLNESYNFFVYCCFYKF